MTVDEFARMLESYFGLKRVEPESRLATDLRFDSLMWLECLEMLEEAAGRPIDPDAVELADPINTEDLSGESWDPCNLPEWVTVFSSRCDIPRRPMGNSGRRDCRQVTRWGFDSIGPAASRHEASSSEPGIFSNPATRSSPATQGW